LASKQLAEYNKKHGEDIGNYGLHDQRRALEWLSDFVGGFGGDPNNVTIHGTSAGGASCHYLSPFPDRRYKRAILASGTFFGIGAVPMEHQQKRFDLLATTVAPGVSEDHALSALLTCETKDLTHTLE
jgi:carboxylesterase type B